MRVLFVVSGLGLGGAEKQVVLLSREIVSRHHQVCIFTLNHRSARVGDLDNVPVQVILEQKRYAIDLRVLFRLRSIVKKWKPDVVHGFLFDGNIYSRLAAMGLQSLVLSSERSDNYVLTVAQRLANRLTRSLVDGVVANTRAGADFASRTQYIPTECCSVVWNGIDLSEVDARMLAARQQTNTVAEQVWMGSGLRRLCVVGSIKPAKDYPLALRVMRCLSDRDSSWRFICVGDKLFNATDEERSRVLIDCERLGLDRVVSFVGPRADALEMIGSSDVLLVTSRREGFPNVVLEGMACGTPVVSTDYSDVRQILPNRWQVAASRDPEHLADIAERCIKEHDHVAASQRAWVELNGTIAASASTLLSIYDRHMRSVSQPQVHGG